MESKIPDKMIYPEPRIKISSKVIVPNKGIIQLHGYKIGDTVWIKPVDAGDLKGKIKGFQMVDDYLPIVEFEYCGKKISNAFTLQRISPYKKGKVKPVYIRVI